MRPSAGRVVPLSKAAEALSTTPSKGVTFDGYRHFCARRCCSSLAFRSRNRSPCLTS